MDEELVQPNSWVALKLPSEDQRILQLGPNTTICLGKYGSFPSNLIIHRPYYRTYELLDKADGEKFCRLRVVSASEIYGDLYDEARSDGPTPDPSQVPDEGEVDAEEELAAGLRDQDIRQAAAAAEAGTGATWSSSRQTLSMNEIEALKRDGASAGRELIAKLIKSHTAIDQKTAWSLAKYKLLKTKKYMRRFTVLPFDVGRLGHHMVEDKDPFKVLEIREEVLAILGCLANVHYGGDTNSGDETVTLDPTSVEDQAKQDYSSLTTGRWLVVDDTGGFLTAAMAERMGILYENIGEGAAPQGVLDKPGGQSRRDRGPRAADSPAGAARDSAATESGGAAAAVANVPRHSTKRDALGTLKGEEDKDVFLQKPRCQPRAKKQQYKSDFEIPYAPRNTLTVLHANSQPNLSFLKHWGFDITSPNPHRSNHPLASHLLTLTWLQLLHPDLDNTYSGTPPDVDKETLVSWKASRRGNYHRKRRRWARTRYTVDTTRRGGFSGLVAASTMDAVSILRHALGLLAGGAPVAIYSQSIEPLAELVDCFSRGRRSAWAASPPKEAEGKSVAELERWQGNKEFPLNPSLLVGVTIHTARARHWQVHPGRTHPLMTSRGGAEGYILTGYRAVPVEGKVAARGKFKRRKLAQGMAAEEV